MSAAIEETDLSRLDGEAPPEFGYTETDPWDRLIWQVEDLAYEICKQFGDDSEAMEDARYFFSHAIDEAIKRVADDRAGET